MTVEINYSIALATLCGWFKTLAQVYQLMKRKTKINRDLHARFFPLFEELHAVIGRSNYFGICFTTLN